MCVSKAASDACTRLLSCLCYNRDDEIEQEPQKIKLVHCTQWNFSQMVPAPCRYSTTRSRFSRAMAWEMLVALLASVLLVRYSCLSDCADARYMQYWRVLQQGVTAKHKPCRDVELFSCCYKWECTFSLALFRCLRLLGGWGDLGGKSERSANESTISTADVCVLTGRFHFAPA